MYYLYINSVDTTTYLNRLSIKIDDQIQNKSNTCSFKLLSGVTRPTAGQDIKIFDGLALKANYSANTITIANTYSDTGKFRIGTELYLGIGLATEEKVTVTAVPSSTTLTISTPTSAHSTGERMGKLVFGGVISSATDSNIDHNTSILEYSVSCYDYTKIFDAPNWNSAYENREPRYIINDQLNQNNNYNKEVDDMEYLNDGAIQTAWIESLDGTNPTLDITTEMQGDSAGIFAWTYSAGSALWETTQTARDFSDFVGVTSGQPTKGNLTLWANPTDTTKITSLKIRIGSDSSNYLLSTVTLGSSGEYTFDSVQLEDGVMTGTPVWTAITYVAIVVAETATSSIKIDDLRITAEGSFTMFNVEEGLSLTNYPISFKKPTRVIQDLANLSSKFWYIDYEKDIHFFDIESMSAPFEIDVTNSSDNFDNLSIKPDISLLKNQQTVRGGTEDSDSTYSQVVEGDSAVREWIMKNLFVNLAVTLDNNTTTHASEAGTTTTNIKITAHGLTTGMHITNRTRSNAVRKITKVDNDNFTVEAVTSQTNGDTISFFATAKTVGVENLDDEASFDYMYNYNAQSVRASTQTATLTSAQFLRFEYTERFPIRVTHQDNASIFAMKALCGGTGVFAGDVITDTSIDSRELARARAEAEINQYSNAIINGSFTTDQEGLKSGQLITVNDTARGLTDQQYLIQKVTSTSKGGEYGDYMDFKVTFASTLFGIIEFFQKLLSENDQIEVDEDETVDLVTAESVEITLSEVNTFTASETASETPTITLTPVETAVERDITSSPYKWQPDATDFRWSLGQWG